MSFQDGRHSILSLVCLAFTLFSFQGAMSDGRCQMSDVRPDTFSSLLSVRIKSWIQISLHLPEFNIQSIFTKRLMSAICRLISVLVGLNGLEPSTSRLSGGRSNLLSYKPMFVSSRARSILSLGGDKRDRTADPLLAKQVLSQLSYTPISFLLGLFLL